MTERFVQAYLQADARAEAFLPHRFEQPAARASVTARAAQRSVAPILQDALRHQNAGLAVSPQREVYLKALGQPGTTCVVTGQQVGLFLGPLYTVYKAAAAIVAARALQAETGRPVVPIFWLQSEDHDFEELATSWVPGADGLESLTAIGDSSGRASIAHRPLGDDLPELRRRLGELLGRLPHAQTGLQRIDTHYRQGVSWVQAFAGQLAELFAEEGLVFLDPRDPALASHARGVHQRAIEQAAAIADGLQHRAHELQAAGFGVPVHIRPGAPLSFCHPEGPAGPRYRLSPTAGGWSLVGGNREVSGPDLQEALESHPDQFSTSALLRPILQDSWLPTAAYVGGPGEIDYFAQLQPLYKAFDLPMPLLIPRARFVVTNAKQHKALQTLGLTPQDLSDSVDDLVLRTCAPTEPNEAEPSQRMMQGFEAELTAMQARLPELEKSIHRTRETVQRACDKLIAKYELSIAQADTQRVATIKRLKNALFPQGGPQERLLGLPYFGALYGDRHFVKAVLDGCEPYDGALRELQL